MVIRNTDGAPQSSKATEIERKRAQVSGNDGPTASTVEVGGRILTPNGQGLRNALVILTSVSGE